MSELTVVVGLGKTGLSCVRYLLRQGKSVVVTDTRAIPPCIQELRSEFPYVPVYLDGLYEDILAQASEIVVSPGICIRDPVLAKQAARGIKLIGDIELFARNAKAPIIAITGSNGKSTVTTLVGEMAKKAGKRVVVGGNLGTPALDLLNEQAELYVLELSSFQLETTFSLKAAVATVLNITPDHLDRYDSYEDYIAAKLIIYNHCQNAVLNRDDAVSRGNLALNAPHVINFGISEPAAPNQLGLRETENGLFLAFGERNLIPANELKIKGRHNYSNALAALALGHAVGLPWEEMLSALKSFPGLRHRCEWVAKQNDVTWYNDSKATNVGAALAALQGLGAEINGKVILLAGGLAKGADFSSLQDAVKQYVRGIILFGRDKQKLKNALESAAPIIEVRHLAEAVDKAREWAQPGDIVLLAPACASFDMFRDFEHRGEMFCELVKMHRTVEQDV